MAWCSLVRDYEDLGFTLWEVWPALQTLGAGQEPGIVRSKFMEAGIHPEQPHFTALPQPLCLEPNPSNPSGCKLRKEKPRVNKLHWFVQG